MIQPAKINKIDDQDKKKSKFLSQLTKFDGIEDIFLVLEYNLIKMNSKLVDE